MIIITIIFFVIDLISKIIISNSMNLFDSFVIIKKFFSITYVHNKGAAWSILSGDRFFLIMISLSIILAIIVYLKKHRPIKKIDSIAYSMILGGAIGNLSNRIFLGYVIDFLDFNIFGYDYPIFNLADTFIVIGVIILFIGTWRK